MGHNNNKHNSYWGLIVIAISTMLTSCIAIDKTEYPLDWDGTIPFYNDDIKSLNGTYRSNGDVVSDSYSMYEEYHYNLGYMLFSKDPSKDDWNVAISSDSISFQILDNSDLLIKALISGEPIDQMILHRNEYTVTDGWLTIDSSRFVAGTAVAGIESRLNQIRLNEQGDLIMKSTESVLGAVTILPAIGSAEYWFRFENVQNSSPTRAVNDAKIIKSATYQCEKKARDKLDKLSDISLIARNTWLGDQNKTVQISGDIYNNSATVKKFYGYYNCTVGKIDGREFVYFSHHKSYKRKNQPPPKVKISKSGVMGSQAEANSQNRFIAHNNGTVTDTKTDLMWASSDSENGLSQKMAQNYCDLYEIAGYSDWRMPTVKELDGLYNAGIRTSDQEGNHIVKIHWKIHNSSLEFGPYDFDIGFITWDYRKGMDDKYARALPVRQN